MRTDGCDLSLAHDDDQVCPANLGEAVGNDKSRSSTRCVGYGALNLVFGSGINRRGRIVQHEDAWISEECARKRNALTLPEVFVAPPVSVFSVAPLDASNSLITASALPVAS